MLDSVASQEDEPSFRGGNSCEKILCMKREATVFTAKFSSMKVHSYTFILV